MAASLHAASTVRPARARLAARGPAVCVLTALSFCMAAPATAQQRAGITVMVVDSVTAAPVTAADVRIESLALNVNSMADGRYTLAPVPAGIHTLVVEAMGYVARRVPVVVADGDTTHVTVSLVPLPLPLPSVDATARAAMRGELGGFWERRERGTGFFLTRGQIEAIGAQRAVDVVARAPGARILRLDAVSGGHIVTFARHSASQLCIPAVYLDGQPLQLNEDGLDLLRPDDLEAVEVYSGPALLPASFNRTGSSASRRGQLSSSPRCGVIVLWTRRGGPGR
jgi:hypothetical protein